VKSTPAAHFININVASAVSVYRAGLWLYMSSIASQLGGYLFWFVAAASVSVAVLGEVAYLATLASIATALLTLGVPTAVMRLWPATGDGRYAEGALAFAVAAAAGSLLFALWRPALALLVASGVLSAYFTAYFQTTYNTRPVFYATVAGQTARVAAAPLLAPLGPDALAATYSIPSLLLTGLGAAAFRLKPRVFGMGELARAGVAAWLPGAVAVLGTNLGVVAAYNLAHAETAGYVYIAQILAGAAVGVSTIVTGVLLPYLASSREPDAAAVKAYRLALAASAPLAAALVTGGAHFLSILGQQYAEAADALAVFTVANLLGLAAASLGSLMYAKGLYLHYLAVGAAANAARIALYVLLGSSDVGVAVSFLAGSLAAVVLYAVFQRPAAWDMAAATPKALLVSLPALLSAPFGILPAAAGAAAGYASAVRLRLVTRGELADLARQILPTGLYMRVAPVASRVLDVLE
jgi:O-antigen/teichoic acid export membrane protein